MGFMDKVKDSVKSADEKLGNAIDKEKLDSEIRKQEKAIEEYTKEIGQKVVAVVKEGKDAAQAEIADLKTQKEGIGKKE